jgi:CRP-like cAMP-binding protein
MTDFSVQKPSDSYSSMNFNPNLRKPFHFPRYESGDLEALSKKDPIKLMSSILSLPSKDRNPVMLRFLTNLTQDFPFFKNLLDEHFSDAHRACCIAMSYAYFECGSYVFMQGDTGSKFYIILEGTVGVHIKVQGAKEPSNEQENRQNAVKQHATQENNVEYEEVMTLTVGDSFGERALMSGQPRAASIFCKTNCHFGVLNIHDYQRILKKAMEKSFQDTINLLQEQPVFKGLTRGAMLLQSYYWKLKKLNKKQVLYKQGDEPKEVFLIKSGEFELTREERTPINERRYSSPSKKSIKAKKFLTTIAKIAIVGPKELLGEEEVLNNSPRLCTCICVSETAFVLAIQKDNFERIVFKNEDRLNLLTERCSMKSEFLRKRIDSLVGVEEKKQLFNAAPIFSHTLFESDTKNFPKFNHMKDSLNLKASFDSGAASIERDNLKSSSESPVARKTTRESLLLALDKLCVRNISTTSGKRRQVIPTHKSIDHLYLLKARKAIIKPKPEKIVNIHTHALRMRQEGSNTSRDISKAISSLSSLHNSPSLHDSHFTHNSDMHLLTQRVRTSGVSMVNINSFPVYQALWNTSPEVDKEMKLLNTSSAKGEQKHILRSIY